MTILFHIPNIKCDGCVSIIKNKLSASLVEINVEYQLPQKIITLHVPDHYNFQEAAQWLADSGFPVSQIEIK